MVMRHLIPEPAVLRRDRPCERLRHRLMRHQVVFGVLVGAYLLFAIARLAQGLL